MNTPTQSKKSLAWSEIGLLVMYFFTWPLSGFRDSSVEDWEDGDRRPIFYLVGLTIQIICAIFLLGHIFHWLNWNIGIFIWFLGWFKNGTDTFGLLLMAMVYVLLTRVIVRLECARIPD